MHILDELAAGTVRCVFSSAPPATVERLLAWSGTRPDGERVVVCDIDPGGPASEAPDDFVRALARAALAVWPDWYGQPDLFARCDEASLQPALDRLAGRAAGLQRSVFRPWVLRAATQCRAGVAPFVPGFAPTTQLQQLARAIAADALTLVVQARPAAEPEPVGLLALARNLEWVARHTAARVAAVLPVGWAARAELDGVSWDCRTDAEAAPGDAGPGAALDEPPLAVGPIRGRPHPNSPGEQLLAARLRRDPALGPLFEYNMPVTTARGTRYQADAVWFAGKVVVEVDGYRWHSSPAAFAGDRQRDYELQLSGYLVLRLPHAGVMADAELAADKVRDLVALRLGRPLPPRPHA